MIPEFEYPTAELDYRADSTVPSNHLGTALINTPQSITISNKSFVQRFEILDINGVEAGLYIQNVANKATNPGDDVSIQIRFHEMPECHLRIASQHVVNLDCRQIREI